MLIIVWVGCFWFAFGPLLLWSILLPSFLPIFSADRSRQIELGKLDEKWGTKSDFVCNWAGRTKNQGMGAHRKVATLSIIIWTISQQQQQQFEGAGRWQFVHGSQFG
jgi:hypothetical protein